jgi:phosphatidylglycerophosphate synthase
MAAQDAAPKAVLLPVPSDMVGAMTAAAQLHGRKVPRQFSCVIDNLVYDIAMVAIEHVFHPAGMTPNHVTFLSLALGLAAAACLTGRWYRLAGVLWVAAYVCDCADGAYARTYGMTSPYGDLLDHGCDGAKSLVMAHALMTHAAVPLWRRAIVAAVLGAGTLVSFKQQGCEQRLVRAMDAAGADDPAQDSGRSTTLAWMEHLCPDVRDIRTVRWLGTGMMTVVLATVVASFGRLSSA